ncbi:hypothetical protein HDV01_007070 [Terramyces sp. JEL0728]|nr:hypothetical protein HDV01_007070 [Terramyces sp. JEL0728]
MNSLFPTVSDAFQKIDAKDGKGKIALEDSKSTSGFTFLCFPGIGDVRYSYRFFADRYSPNNRVVVADLRGTGDSDSAFTEYTPEAVAEDYNQIIEKLELKNVILVGNSLAASSAVLASNNPNVKGAILLGPILRVLPGDKYFKPLSYLLFAKPWGPSAWVSYWQGLFKRPDKPDKHDEHIKKITEMVSGPNQVGNIGKFARASKQNAFDHLPKVTVPVLLVLGDQDPDYPDPRKEGELYRDQIKNSGLYVLDKVGHYPHVEASTETFELIDNFVKTL